MVFHSVACLAQCDSAFAFCWLKARLCHAMEASDHRAEVLVDVSYCFLVARCVCVGYVALHPVVKAARELAVPFVHLRDQGVVEVRRAVADHLELGFVEVSFVCRCACAGAVS